MTTLGKRAESPGQWQCTWCHYINIRQNVGLDHCSACGAETLTYRSFENDIHIRYSLRPKQRKYSTNLDCAGISGGIGKTCVAR